MDVVFLCPLLSVLLYVAILVLRLLLVRGPYLERVRFYSFPEREPTRKQKS
jgi:hypothetical protein